MKGGRLIGTTNASGERAESPIPAASMNASIYKAAGINYQATMYTSFGRPFPIVPDGEAIKDLFR